MSSPEAVRLVIWDLDETFWRGTLTEGGIREYVTRHHDAVIELARRGIISSICSKNDYGTVERILRAKGIWDYFVLASINWQPKGPRIKALIEEIGLRPTTILFIDDNPGNRAEALAAVPGLQVCDDRVIADLEGNPLFVGKNDVSLSRLSQYKLLEKRATEKTNFGGDNTAFLRQSQIRITIDYDIVNNLDRAIEIINRTNQLNFTKVRLPEDQKEARQQLIAQLDKFDVRAGLVSVKDRFGEYGHCGFFLLSGHWGAKELKHFAFSCRVLGMGIEQWIYHKLGKPKLIISGEVISELSSEPDWINVDKPNSATERDISNPHSVRIRGACELEILEQFFGLNSASLVCETVRWRDGLVVQKHHTALLHQSFQPSSPELIAAIEPFVSPDEVRSHFLDPCRDGTLLIYSNIADAHHELYRHKSLPLHIPIWLMGLGQFNDWSPEQIQGYITRHNLTETQAERIYRLCELVQSDFELVAESDNATLRRMYKEIILRVPPNALLIWVLPRHTFFDADGKIVENQKQLQLNQHVCEVAGNSPNVLIAPFEEAFSIRQREFPKTGHLDRLAYYQLFLNLCSMYANWLREQPRALSTEVKAMVP